MEHYTKGEEVAVECVPPFPKELMEGVKEMVVKEGTKFRNILSHVEKQFQDPTCRRVLFKGIGEATAKCISCVEVFKRSYQDGSLYQWNAVAFSRRSDVWNPDPSKEDLSKLLVHVDVPTIFILVSRDQFPPEFVNDSCQISSEDVNGFASKPQEAGEGSSKRRTERWPEKPSLKRPSEPNKWKRPPKKSGGAAASMPSGSKPS